MRNILKETTEGAGAIILCTTRVKTSICVEFTMMDQPEERFAAGGGGSIVPDVNGEIIVREMRVSQAIESRGSGSRVS